MNSQKIENILNLCLDSTEQEREKSQILEVGFNREQRTWEVIVKFHGDISQLSDEVIKVEVLLNGYAIITIPEVLLESLSGLEQIEYIEKPKRLIYDVYEAKRSSGILTLVSGETTLTGKGVIIAVIDSGIDYFLQDFQDQNGSRILFLWDQTATPNGERGWLTPSGFASGVEYTKAQIDQALATGNQTLAKEIVPETDIMGHGTAVTGIAAGSNSNALYRGIAPESDLIIVKLGLPGEQGLPRTTELMRAITYVLKKAQELQKPVSINLSLGSTYGSHDGSSLIERFLDNASEVNRSVVCVGSGNEAASGGHTSGRLINNKRIELAIGSFESSISVQLWKNYADIFKVDITAPGGERFTINMNQIGRQTWNVLNTTVLIYVSLPTPYSINQEIFFDLIPRNTDAFINTGIWTFDMTPVKTVTGNFQMYLPNESVRSSATRFLAPNSELTLTIPSTASKVITVGAYNSLFNACADFSGRGEQTFPKALTTANLTMKPDIVAPGVSIMAPALGGGHEPVTGTSFATPIVTGSAALLMQWGIVKGNDPNLYGEKVKAYFIKGARQLPGFTEYPNPQVGWGALCVRDSLPFL